MPQDEFEDPDAIRVGDDVHGRVISFVPTGVLVDIGTSEPGLLVLPPHVKRDFRAGDCVQSMRAEQIDPDCVTLSIENPEIADPESQLPPRLLGSLPQFL